MFNPFFEKEPDGTSGGIHFGQHIFTLFHNGRRVILSVLPDQGFRPDRERGKPCASISVATS